MLLGTVKFEMNSFLDPTCVPVRILINKLNLIPNQMVAGLVSMFRNSRGQGTGESYTHPSLLIPNVDFAALQGILSITPSCLSGSMVSLLIPSVVLDLKMV